VQASDKFADFGLPDPLPATQPEIDVYRKALQPLITGSKLEDVAILGEGVIDGAGAGWWAKSDKVAERAVAAAALAGTKLEKPLYIPRPYLVVLRDCARVHLQGVTLRNSPLFHFVPHHCHDVVVEDVTIFSPAVAPNTDGIDPANSRDVLIRRCTIDTGDDDVALKGGGLANEPTENVTVTECKILHGHGVSIGSETEAGVRNFLVEKCSFENTGTALRIKSGRTRGGLVENVTYRDITMKNVEAAITLSLFYEDQKSAQKPELKPVTETTPRFRNVHFQNITCDGATKKAGEITGLPESPITGVTLENVRITNAAAPFTQQDAVGLEFRDVQVQSAATPTP
jgi:polygalacturonase